MKKKNKKGFTLAEVLITLSIIGIIAAILFPSILANYNERTLKAKRQALLGRMSQAMGELSDQFRTYEDISCNMEIPEGATDEVEVCKDNGSALKFINEGLSKVYKIAASCDNKSLTSCDIPEDITLADGSNFSLKEKATSLLAYNPQISLSPGVLDYDTESAGLMTKNGESILLFYNPRCLGKASFGDSWVYSETQMCVNMIYDLNGGKNKPNRIGEDVGFMTVFYSTSPYVVEPKPYDWKGVPDFDATSEGTVLYINERFDNQDYQTAKANCQALGENVGLPSREEGMSMQINRELWAPRDLQVPASSQTGGAFWSSTLSRPDRAWMFFLENTDRENDHHLYGRLYDTSFTSYSIARCVYKD